MNERLELEVTPKGSSPEVKLWSAVVALAIKDICEKPSKKKPVSLDAISGFRFLLTKDSDWVLEALDIDPVAFRERIHHLMWDGVDTPWRYARINHMAYIKLIEEGSAMSKEYRQNVTIGDDTLEARWYHATADNEVNGWLLVEVDGFPENMCPEEIWKQVEDAFDINQMEDIDDRDFDLILEDEERLKNGW